ncbi:von Willebrand factor-like isoform X3 [Petromyzon marinus]
MDRRRGNFATSPKSPPSPTTSPPSPPSTTSSPPTSSPTSPASPPSPPSSPTSSPPPRPSPRWMACSSRTLLMMLLLVVTAGLCPQGAGSVRVASRHRLRRSQTCSNALHSGHHHTASRTSRSMETLQADSMYQVCGLSDASILFTLDGDLSRLGTFCGVYLLRGCDYQPTEAYIVAEWSCREGEGDEGDGGGGCSLALLVSVPGVEELRLQNGAVYSGDTALSLPASLKSVRLYRVGDSVLLTLSGKLLLQWDGALSMEVFVERARSGSLCGVCTSTQHETNSLAENSLSGDCSSNSSNSSYCQNNNNVLCSQAATFHVPGCDFPSLSEILVSHCSQLLCKTAHNLQEALCSAQRRLLAICSARLQENLNHLLDTACTHECPQGMEFTTCASPCVRSCASLHASLECPDACLQGCQCPEGMVLHDSKCIPDKLCPCLLHGQPHAAGQKVSMGCTEW